MVKKTLKQTIHNNKTVIKLKIPKYLLVIYSFVILCSFLIIPFLIKINLLYAFLLVGFLAIFNIYRLIGLFIRKFVVDELNDEIIFYTPIKIKTTKGMIEYINRRVKESHEGIDRYYIEIKIKNRRRLIKYETTSDEQSSDIKSILE